MEKIVGFMKKISLAAFDYWKIHLKMILGA